MKSLRIGVIGTGYWGPNIIRNVADMPEAYLLAICDKNPDRLTPYKRRYPQTVLTTDPEAIFANPSIEAVAIATPISTHFDLAKRALLAGKHVFVEKPLAGKSSEARELTRLAAKKHLTLMVDHIFIYSPPVQKIKQLMTGNKLGEIYYFDSVRVNLGLFQKDANVIWDLAPHDLAIMDYLLEQNPRSVSATAVKHIRGSGSEDLAYITIRYSNQLIAHIHVNWLAPAKIRQILIGGAKRMIVYDDLHPTEKVKVYDKGVHLLKNVQRQIEYRLGDMWAPNLDLSEALRLALRHFVQCINQKRAPLSDGRAGTRIVELIEAIQKSVRSRGKEIFL